MQSQISRKMQQVDLRSRQESNSLRPKRRSGPQLALVLAVLAVTLLQPATCWLNLEPLLSQTLQVAGQPTSAPPPATVQQDSSPPVQVEAAKPEPASLPSPAAKLLEVLREPAVGNASSQLGQLIKPRKTAADPSTQTGGKRGAQSAEQQILNQHARVHSFPSESQLQRLAPSRHQKLGGEAPQPSASASRDSPLTSLFGHLKSGISSRSSIVKAISDNKLARTMANVGKTIGGNRYVAGAAALAALGLTFSKLLSPYIYATGYSKMNADPMLASGSFLAPSSGAYFGSGPDRTFFYSGPSGPLEGEPLLGSGSGLVRSTSPAYPFASSFEPAGFEQAHSSAAYQDFYPTSVRPAGYAGEQYYYAYTPVSPSRAPAAAQPDTQGHYASFYSGQPTADRDYLSAGSPGEASTIQQQQQQYADQLVPAASYESASAQPSARVQVDGNSRRSGPVALKVDGATKLRLQQHLQSQLATGNRWSAGEWKSQQVKASRQEPASYANRQSHASASSHQLEQGRPELTASASKPAYLLIRPRGQAPAGGPWKSLDSGSFAEDADQQVARQTSSNGAQDNGLSARTRISRTPPTGKSVKTDQTVGQPGSWQQMTTLLHQPTRQQQQVASPQPITNLIRLTADEESNDHDNKHNGDNSDGSHGNDNGNNDVVKLIESLTSSQNKQHLEQTSDKTSGQDSSSSSSSSSLSSAVATGELTPTARAQLATDEAGQEESRAAS